MLVFYFRVRMARLSVRSVKLLLDRRMVMIWKPSVAKVERDNAIRAAYGGEQ